MKRKVLYLCLVSLLGLVLVWLHVPVVSACVPLDDGMTRCDRLSIVRPKVVTVAAAAVRPAVVAPPSSPKRGTSPSDAMDPNDSWQTIAANQSIWYRLGEDTISRLHLDVWLDANGKTGIGFAVYSPEQMGDVSGVVPKGRGTANRNDKTHDLSWTGQAPAGGTWYVLVTNSNSTPLPYKLGYNRVVTGPREGCSGPYGEHLGAWVNNDVVWPGYCP